MDLTSISLKERLLRQPSLKVLWWNSILPYAGGLLPWRLASHIDVSSLGFLQGFPASTSKPMLWGIVYVNVTFYDLRLSLGRYWEEILIRIARCV